MKYTVDPWVFEKNPEVCFGIIIGKDLDNSETTAQDSEMLKAAEQSIQEKFHQDNLKTHPQVAIYREALRTVDINPNKYRNSVEAMIRRVYKSGALPRINALVDVCNAVALENIISLGGHHLDDIKADLAVRLSKEGDQFLPFGEKEFESVEPGELVFTSGNEVQTRQWLWRQSELGKITLDSQDIIFQLVGFQGEFYDNFENAIKTLETLIEDRFDGSYETFIVTQDNNSITFKK
jgi:DNA/RNA-binding domain of Phe-tRNA-synthetase-like protein